VAIRELFAVAGEFLKSKGERPVTITRMNTVEDVLKAADVVSLHCNLDATTRHLMNAERLNMMKVVAKLFFRGEADGDICLVVDYLAHSTTPDADCSPSDSPTASAARICFAVFFIFRIFLCYCHFLFLKLLLPCSLLNPKAFVFMPHFGGPW
jgi:hypothetical protein